MSNQNIKRVWNDEGQDWDYFNLPKVPVRPVNMRVRYRNGYVLYEPLVGSGGGIRIAPDIPSASCWLVPISVADLQQP